MRQRLRRRLQPWVARIEGWRDEVLEIRAGDPLAAGFAEFGVGSVMKPPYQLGNTTAVALGRDVIVHSGVIFEALAPPNTVVIRIGDGSYIGHRTRFVALNGIEMARDCVVGHGVTLTDTVHGYRSGEEAPPGKTSLKLGRPLRLGEGAWIGNNSVVTGGITIGDRAIVGANSTVNRDVPADTVVLGTPARPVRRRRGDGTWEWLVDATTLEAWRSEPDESHLDEA